MYPRHKYNNVRTEKDGMKFDSKKEARYYEQLKSETVAGKVLFFLRQVPFHLAGGVKYVCDFLVFYVDGRCAFIDVKGLKTAMYKVKKRLVEAAYPVTIEEV